MGGSAVVAGRMQQTAALVPEDFKLKRRPLIPSLKGHDAIAQGTALG